MSTISMSIANLNLVFGEDNEPLLSHINDFVLPALNSGFVRNATEKTKFLFSNVELNEIEEGEFILQGVLIKDTMLDIESVLSGNNLVKTDEHVKSSPYSIFMIYLKNHRMILAKNQKGSPDLRAFGSTLREVLTKYRRSKNRKKTESNRKQICIVESDQDKKEIKNSRKQLPTFTMHINGIKTSEGMMKVLENVEKINKLTLKFFPLNSEWDLNPQLEGLEEIRRRINSKNGNLTFLSPGSKQEVAHLIESAEGTVEPVLNVTYVNFDDSKNKKKGTIKGNEIAENMTVKIDGELDESFEAINRYKKNIRGMNVYSKSNVIEYHKFVDKLKKH